MLSQKCFQKLACLALIVACAGAFAQEGGAYVGNGGGYSGPDLKGTSIPVRLDRGITLENAQNAIFTCMVSGDKASGRVSMLARFIRQVYGGNHVEYNSFQNASELIKWRPGMRNELKIGGTTGSFSSDSGPGGIVTTINLMQDLNHYLQPEVDDSSRFLTLAFTSPASNTDVYAQTARALPTLVFDQVVPEAAYDDWGVETYRSSLLKNISIRTDAPLSASTPLFVYHNYGKPNQKIIRLKVTLNTREYVECLQTELQKRAN